MSAYTTLEARFREIHLLGSVMGQLHWDSATQMPAGGVNLRGEQLAFLEAECHRRQTAPEVGEWLDRAADEALDDWQRANLRMMRFRYLHAAAVPETIATRLVEAGTACEYRWREARKTNDFNGFAQSFEPVLALVREKAAAKADALKLDPYDALLDGYDPGRRMAQINRLFAQIEREVPAMVDAAIARQPQTVETITLPVTAQQTLGRNLAEVLGFDFTAGRMDVSAHPFCGGLPGDVRITARYQEGDPLASLMGVLHETGHALYEQGLPAAWFGQPVGEAVGMVIHESQSLIVEMQLCRSRGFLRYLAGIWPEAMTADRLSALANRVERSLIRVDADELTYPLHILLRTRLEQRLLDGSLAVRDLPEAWNEGMRSLIGIVPDSDANGCLQDIHWTDGSFGYFPTYTLGAMAAAQIRSAMQNDLPDWEERLARGEWAEITGWLHRNIHHFGSYHLADDLLQQATGQPLTIEPYLAHLRRRYLES